MTRTLTAALRSVVLSCALATTVAAATLAQSAPPLAYTRFVLPNGLVTLLNVDHTSPIVAVHVWYHVGSRDDPPDRAGMVHLCEHLMSQGSPNLDLQQPVFYRSLGGTANASTLEDVTKYYATVPSNQLETVLWAEADRMAAPLSRAQSERFAGVRAVVQQERQQNVDAIPFGTFREANVAALFPTASGYHSTPLSFDNDLFATTPDDVKAACAPYYVPNNAVVALSGDFEPAMARRWIEKYFGSIPSGAVITHRANMIPALEHDTRLVLEDTRATVFPQLHVAWRGASYANADRIALLALANALSLPRFGRLSKLLVNDRRLASTVLVDNSDFEQSGVFEITVVSQPPASLTLIETLVDSVLASLTTAPITAEELARFKNSNAVNLATSLQMRSARADTLAHDEMYAGNAAAHAAQVAVANALTPGDIQRVVQKYLTKGRVVTSLVPAGKLDLVSKPDAPYVNVTPKSAVVKP